jgi:hypothetical protein
MPAGSPAINRYGWDLYDAFTSGTLASLSDLGPSRNPAGMVPSAGAVVFVDDRDAERAGGALSCAARVIVDSYCPNKGSKCPR